MLEQQYFRPETIEEALELLDKYGSKAKVLAGGTDLIIGLREGIVSCKYLIDIKKIKEMNEIAYSEERGLSIGGAVSLNDMIDSESIHSSYSVLKEGARVLANSLLRNRATMMGNICNASPAGDMLPVAIVLEGKIEAASISGRRQIPLKEFFLGVKKNALKENEIAVKITFPVIEGKGAYFRKSRIKGHDLSQIGVAGFLKENGKLNLTLGAAAPVPVIMDDFGDFTKEDLRKTDTINFIIEKVQNRINPISDQRASREYRMAMAQYLTCKVLEKLAEEA